MIEGVSIPSRLTDDIDGELVMNIEPSIAVTTIDSLDYLNQYPHYCVEQTTSRLLPNIVTYRALQELGILDSLLEQNLLENIDKAHAKLRDEQQKIGGGWGWFQNMADGTAFGTPRYISPEQAISSQQAVPASDQYSLAVIIYEMLTNKTPFDDDSAMSLALSHITNPPPNPQEARSELNDTTAEAILKSLEKTPEDRYKTVTEFIEALATAFGVSSLATAQLPVDSALFQAPDSATSIAINDDTAKLDQAQAEPAPKKRSRKASAKKEVKPKQEKNNKKAPPRATNIPKKERVPMQKQEEKNRQPLYLVGGLILIVLLILGGAAIFAGGGNGDDDNNNVSSGGVSLQDDIILEYTNDFLVIYNQSDETHNLVGLEFVAPDNTNRFLAQDFGVTQTLPNFTSDFCAHIYLNNNKQDPPSYCKLDEDDNLENGKTLGYNSQTQSNTKYWVWLQGGIYEEFNVVLNGDILKTCPSKPGKCSFSLPN